MKAGPASVALAGSDGDARTLERLETLRQRCRQRDSCCSGIEDAIDDAIRSIRARR